MKIKQKHKNWAKGKTTFCYGNNPTINQCNWSVVVLHTVIVKSSFRIWLFTLTPSKLSKLSNLCLVHSNYHTFTFVCCSRLYLPYNLPFWLLETTTYKFLILLWEIKN